MAQRIRLGLDFAKELLFKHYGLTTLAIQEAHGTFSQNFIISAKFKESENQYVFKVMRDTESDRRGEQQKVLGTASYFYRQ